MPCAPQSIHVHTSILMQLDGIMLWNKTLPVTELHFVWNLLIQKNTVFHKRNISCSQFNILSSYQIQLNPSSKWWWMFTTLGTLSLQWKCLRSLYFCSISFLDWLTVIIRNDIMFAFMLTLSKPWPPEAAAAVFSQLSPLLCSRLSGWSVRLCAVWIVLAVTLVNVGVSFKWHGNCQLYGLTISWLDIMCLKYIEMVQWFKRYSISNIFRISWYVMWYARILCPPESPGVSEASPQHPMHHLWHIQSVSDNNISSSFQTNCMYYL